MSAEIIIMPVMRFTPALPKDESGWARQQERELAMAPLRPRGMPNLVIDNGTAPKVRRTRRRALSQLAGRAYPAPK